MNVQLGLPADIWPGRRGGLLRAQSTECCASLEWQLNRCGADFNSVNESLFDWDIDVYAKIFWIELAQRRIVPVI